MANQPELPQYDAGVYQIETVDAVDGGVGSVTNRPLLSLANRTAWLKKHVDDIESGAYLVDAYAPKESPDLTGTPTAPTQAAGDSSTKIATDAFVQAAVNGQVSVNVAGGTTTTLTQVQYGVATIILTGAVTANKSVVFPTQAGNWQVVNNTTGNFTITLKTAAGTGVPVTRLASTNIYCDGTNVGLRQTDFFSPALTGTPLASTAPKFATGGQIINADAMRAAGLQLSGVRSINLSVTNIALTVDDVGSFVVFTGSGGGTLTLPKANTVPAGGTISLRASNTSVSTNTIAASSGDTLSGMVNSGAVPGVLRSGDSIVVVSNGVNTWHVLSDATYNFVVQAVVQLFSSGQLIANNGYLKIPGGIILQWGVFAISSLAAGTVADYTITLPTAFPAACLIALGSCTANSITISIGRGTLQLAAQARNVTANSGAGTGLWLALGY